MQTLLRRFLPRSWLAALERETRQWVVVCTCGERRDLWEAGGIRYKARGKPRVYHFCSACDERTWHTIRKK